MIPLGTCPCPRRPSTHPVAAGNGKKKSASIPPILQTGIAKAGHLFLQDSTDASSYDRRYVLLTSHSLTHYSRSDSLHDPLGDILLTSGTTVLPRSDGSVKISTGYEVMVLRGRDGEETDEWRKAVEGRVRKVGKLLRGYLEVEPVRGGGRRKRGRKRGFFMLHSECITRHPSHTETTSVEDILPLTEMTTVTVDDDSTPPSRSRSSSDDDDRPTTAGLFVVGSNPGTRWKVRADDFGDMDRWGEAVERAVVQLRRAKEDVGGLVPALRFNDADTVRTGNLAVRNMAGEWIDCYFVLTKDCLYQVSGDPHSHPDVPMIKYKMSPNTTVSSTLIHRCSFEVVTFSSVVHLNASTPSDRSAWTDAIRGRAKEASYDVDDPLQGAALRKRGRFYDVGFEAKDSPGLVLERRGEWALVTRVTPALRGRVSVGSSLVAVNNTSVVLKPYEFIIDFFASWKPPLTLRFRAAPEKEGWLYRQERQITGLKRHQSGAEPDWTRRYVRLLGGRLEVYSDGNGAGEETTEEVELYGSAVSLVHPKYVDGHRFCFRVMSGLETHLLRASNEVEMLDWASSLVHGISIERGGGFLLDLERGTRGLSGPIPSLADDATEHSGEAEEVVADAQHPSSASIDSSRENWTGDGLFDPFNQAVGGDAAGMDRQKIFDKVDEILGEHASDHSLKFLDDDSGELDAGEPSVLAARQPAGTISSWLDDFDPFNLANSTASNRATKTAFEPVFDGNNVEVTEAPRQSDRTPLAASNQKNVGRHGDFGSRQYSADGSNSEASKRLGISRNGIKNSQHSSREGSSGKQHANRKRWL